MDWHEAFTAVLTVAVGSCGWLIKHLIQRIEELEKQAQANRLHLAEKYINKEDIKELFAELNAKLDTLFDLLHKKADKP